jgi:uncharacterized caspase-like protein
MPPIGIGSSYSTETLKTGEAKLWLLLVGVNEYQDEGLPSLRYPAVDCQGLGEALAKATQGFPNKEVIVHNDFAAQPPTLERIRESLERIISQTQPQDSIMLYFSGHGMLEPENQEAVLCMSDTRISDLLGTGLPLHELLQMLGTTSANQQLICLDTCHSGDMKLLGGNGGSARSANNAQTLFNPTQQVTKLLQQRAAQSKGFCALLSCDQGQQSWEFPELGHGVFTYYLMKGLLGEAADSHGIIETDGLYKYVYRKTLQYIDKLNQQLRLINQQKVSRGDSKLHPEYPLQTPKRIVEGVGELILGYKGIKAESHENRRAIVIDGFSNNKTTTDLGRLFAGAGGFEVEFFPGKGKAWSDIRGTIQEFVRWNGESETKTSTQLRGVENKPTSLLYLRGHIEEIEDGEAWLILGDGVRLSRSWLRQELRRSLKTQQIIILDCPEATSLDSWIEDLQSGAEQGQCIIAVACGAEEPELFSQALLETLVAANPRVGLSVPKWVTELQKLLEAKNIELHVWLSGTQAVIDVLPGNITTVFQDFPESEVAVQKNYEKSFSSPQQPPQSEQKSSVASPIANQAINTVQPQFSLAVGTQEYTKLEQLVKQSIGPIAPTLLQKALTKVANFQELVENLTAYFSKEQQQEFQQRAMAILGTSTSNSSSVTNQTIDANSIGKCERELAYSVGPIANFIIQEVLKSHPQISFSEFVKKLAKQIPNTKQSLEFEQRMLAGKK